jgi:primosomal protein N'
VGKAGRLVGSRREGRGLVIVQTRRGEDGVLEALREGNFETIVDGDVATAELLGIAPYGASAEVTGDGASDFVEGVAREFVNVLVAPSGYVLRAKDIETLTRALRDAPRPTAKFRVAVF